MTLLSAACVVAGMNMVPQPDRFNGRRADLSSLNKTQMMRYARSMQESVAATPDMLLKLAGEDVRLILAAPDLARVDLPSVVWQYRTASCVLDVYLDAGRGDADQARVAYYEARSRSGEDMGAAEAGGCLQGLYADRAGKIAESFQQIFAAYGQSARRAG